VADEQGEHRTGRGAYLCTRQVCLDRAFRRRALQKALRTSAAIELDELLRALERRLKSESELMVGETWRNGGSTR
jgi:predicted RNA-binding protein YlxR (DUF448 family)